ncbi:MAG: type II secretion system protein GspL [Sphingomonas sp.]
MSDTLVLFLPNGLLPMRWLRLSEHGVGSRGMGLPAIDPERDGAPVAIAPADTVTLHWAELPDRSLLQAVAAARVLVADASAAALSDLHVAVGREEGVTERPIAVVTASQMHAWLGALADDGIDPAAIIPAPMLLPRPADGYIRADLGGDGVVRGTTSGFADEARLTELITGGAAPMVMAREDVEAAIARAIAAPGLDLRQGEFARRTRRTIDWMLVRRLAWMGTAILGVTLATSLTEIVKYNLAATRMEARADASARTGLARGETVNDADRQLTERLARLRGAGLGFSRTAAAVYAAIASVPGTELRSLAFDGNGALRATVAAQGEGQITDITTRIERAGFAVQQSTLTNAGGIFSGDLTVTAR